ncbi:MAG: ABC transporter ATP-binding protein [Lachnospiraceae bacterium]|nr:ABC transporter ATP-binding protein [Lachnospiraceae bacterium]
MEKGTPFLKVENLEVKYTSGKRTIQAVNDVSFTLERGKTLGLVGETGAGKTTIAKAIMRILPTPPAKLKSGSVELDGISIMDLKEEEMRKIRGSMISMIFQDPMTALNPLISIGEQICESVLLHNNSISRQEAVKKSIEMLEMVGIPGERYEEFPFQFSGGMKQRVVIAMALACNPALLLADEPTTALDVTIQAQVLELIKDLQNRFGTSMILITHDLGVVAETCDQVAVIYAGEIVEMGDKNMLYKHASHPYTKGLFDSLPHTGDVRLKPIEGMPPDPANLPEGCRFHPRCPRASEKCRSGYMEMKEIARGHFCRCCMVEQEETIHG